MKKKTLQVQISLEFYSLLEDLAKMDDKSLSQFIRELFSNLAPGLRQAHDLMKTACEMTEEARKAMFPELIRHGEQIESNVKYGLDNMNKLLVSEDKQNVSSDPPQYKLPIK